MADGRSLRWAGHRDQRRADFVEGALDVLDRVGPAATVDQIAAERGVTRQALYRQFDDRADLDRAISLRAADLLLEQLLPHLSLSSDVPSTVRATLDAYLDFVQSHLHLYRFVRSHEASAVEGVKSTVGSRVAALATEVVGSHPLVDSFAVGVVGLADAVVSSWLDDPGDRTRADVVEQLVLMVTGVVDAVLISSRLG